jgi:peptidoglycan hydrolase CwlO-like protein
MRKHVTALLAAFLITTIVGLGMFVIGGNAAMNKDSVPVLNSPGDKANTDPAAANQTQLEQYQNLVAQYQQREKQYQSELSDAQNQLDQAAATIQQYQQLLEFLAERGIIQVGRDGRIFVPGN